MNEFAQMNIYVVIILASRSVYEGIDLLIIKKRETNAYSVLINNRLS